MIHHFGWQKLLITQVPQGCGGGGGGGAPQCTMTDYHDQWTQVQNLYNSVLAEIPKIKDESAAFPKIQDVAGSNNARILAEQALAAHVDRVIADANTALAIDATIPESWFTNVGCIGAAGDLGYKDPGQNTATNNATAHADARRQFENVVSTLGLFRPIIEKETYHPTVTYTWIPPKTKEQILADQVAALESRLGSMQRWFGKSIEPEPAEDVYPRGSWQYALWTYGYSLKEIAWAESDVKTGDYLNKYGGDFQYLLNVIKVDLDNVILSGKVVRENNSEEGTYIPGKIVENPGIIPSPPDFSGHWYAPNGVIGTGGGSMSLGVPAPNPGDVSKTFIFYLDPNASNGSIQTVSYEAYVPPGTPNTSPPAHAIRYASSLIPKGVNFSAGPWKIYNMLPAPPKPVDPQPGMPIDSEYYRTYRRRYQRSGWHNANPFRSRNGFKGPTGCLPWIDTPTPIRDPITPPYDPRGWCGTGDTGASIDGRPDIGFEPWLMGKGYTPDQIDTVRRVLRPGVGGQRRIRPGKGLGMKLGVEPYGQFMDGAASIIGSVTGSTTNYAASPNLPISSDNSWVPPTLNSAVNRLSVAARRQATRARRAIHR